MADEETPRWTFLSRHAQALLCIARDPDVRLRDIADQLDITPRAAQHLVNETSSAMLGPSLANGEGGATITRSFAIIRSTTPSSRITRSTSC